MKKKTARDTIGRQTALFIFAVTAVWTGCAGNAERSRAAVSEMSYIPTAAAVEAVLQGEIRYASGDFKGAAEAFGVACRESRRDAYLTARLADATDRATAEDKGANESAALPHPVLSRADGLLKEGRTAAVAGNKKEAVSLLRTGLRQRPGRVNDRLLLIDLLLDLRNFEEARRHIDSLPAPADTESAVTQRASLLLRAAMPAEARQLLYDFWGSKDPSSDAQRCLAATAERSSGRPEAANRLLEEGLGGDGAVLDCDHLFVEELKTGEPSCD